MGQVGCPQGALRERLSDAVDCARVVRVQRRRRYQSHLMFIDDIELTFVNTCNLDVSTVCINRKYVLEYSGGFAMEIEAFDGDGRRLSILRRDERCLLDREPGLDYLCIRLNEPIKPGNYYVVTLTHTAQTSIMTVIESRRRRLVNFLTPYFDVYVFSIIYPINQPQAPWTQSQYHHYEVVPEHLEIHGETTNIVRGSLNIAPGGKFIVSDPKNLAFGFITPETPHPSQLTSQSAETPLLRNIAVLALLLFTVFGVPIPIRLTLNRLYKAFSWMFQLLSIATIALSWTTLALLLIHKTYLLSDLLALLTTLALLLLSNYIVIPKQAPIKYKQLWLCTYIVMVSLISLIITIIIKTIAIIP